MLIELDALKTRLGITSADEDPVLIKLIRAASEQIENEIGFKVLAADYTEFVDGNGKQRMFFYHRPVTMVYSLKVGDDIINAANDLTEDGYRHSASVIQLNHRKFDVGFLNVTMQYRAGYETVPTPIEDACALIVGGMRADADRLGVSAKSLAGETIHYFNIAMSAGVKQTLAAYKRVC